MVELLGVTGAYAAQMMILSLVAVGGAHAVLPDVYRFLVTQNGWIDGTTFASLVALSQAAPGPNVLVLTMLGYQISGFPGAVAGVVAFCLPSSVMCFFIARWDTRGGETPWKRIIKAGLAPLTVGVVVASGCILVAGVGASVLVVAIAAATAYLSATKKWNPLWYIGAGALLSNFL